MADVESADASATAGTAASTGPYDLLLLVDATYSMQTFIRGLNKALPDILRIAALTDSFEKIGVMAYRDYCCKNLTSWSGWCHSTDNAVDGLDMATQKTVLYMAASIMTQGNDDIPEASKTGLAYAYEKMRTGVTTMIILYTDAPPHLKQVSDKNGKLEQAALNEPDSYGGTGHLFADWTSAAKTMRDGPKKANVFPIIKAGDVGTRSSYLYLSQMTGGMTIVLPQVTADAISVLTTTMLLTWMGTDQREMQSQEGMSGVDIPIYHSTKTISNATSEDHPKLRKYLATQFSKVCETNTTISNVLINELGTVMRQRGPPVGNFVDRYNNDEKYKDAVISQLRRIFEENVIAMSLNPVFGSLWRAVCNGRGGTDRDVLAPALGYHIDRIENPEKKARMKKWLEQSYDYTRTIEKEVSEVAAENRYPLVFLDPTTNFANVSMELAKDGRELHQFERSELLEIGRSCGGRVLERLGKVLTRLTITESEEDLPAHVKGSDGSLQVPYVPLALTRPEYKRRFWKVLLHTVLPGTMMATRAAAVLAALSLRMGIVSLRDAADAELLAFGPKWNDITTPENWAPGCIQLILNADQNYEDRVATGTAVRSSREQYILTEQDRSVFRTMLEYKILESYLLHPINANISWHPNKNQAAVGPVTACTVCNYPRSVTIMAENGICGICTAAPASCTCVACSKTAHHDEQLCANVCKEDNENSVVAWVECSMTACRAQYVVYNPKKLVVRAKCYYCRHVGNKAMEKIIGNAPFVECDQCLSRMIWPHEYRPEGFNDQAFKCPGCQTGVKTVVPQETTPQAMREENGWEWLLKNLDNAIKSPFNGRSLFHIVSHCGIETIASKVELLPFDDTIVTFEGKKVQNITEIKESIRQRIKNRESGTISCSLCFFDFAPSSLRSACGRNGCKQRICSGCIKSWYSLNEIGRIINTAAVSCPFCRRIPAPKIARRHRITDIGSLSKALAESGTWIHAWCWRCNHAKPYMERVCANGAPEPVSRWRCEECTPVPDESTAKFCPGCGVLTEKSSGCHHMTCPCGEHWCYGCGEALAERHIYSHIAEKHGGLEVDWDEGHDEEYGYESDL